MPLSSAFPAASASLHTSNEIPHCTEDRRPSYTILEMPPITNEGNAPRRYLESLYDTIQTQVEKRKVWQVVSGSETTNNVVIFNISMLEWENLLDSPTSKHRMEMQLSLVDKSLGCEVNETTGQGQVVADASGNADESGIANVADGAGWFVENVLLHNQFN